MSAREFQLQLSKEWQQKMDDVAEAIAGIGLVALSGIVRKSPVDTGRFRGNWITSIMQVDTRQIDRVDPSGAAAIREGSAVLEAYPDEMPPIYIQNNLPYANRLENGWSGQAPSGMVALTIVEIEAQFDGTEV